MDVAITYFKDSSITPVVALRVIQVALIFIIPIDHEYRSVRTGFQVDDLRPTVVELNEVRGVMSDEARALNLGNIHVDTGAMNIVHENLACKLVGPAIALINEQTSVS